MGQFAGLDLGPCAIIFNGTDLGASSGGVTFRDEVSDADIKEDANGDTPVDSVLTGRLVTVEVPLTRTSLANLATVTPGATAGGANVKVGNNIVGTAQLANAKELVLKPIKAGIASTTEAEWLHIFKASPLPKFEIGYDTKNQRIFKVTFKAYPTTVSGTTGLIYRFGAA